MGGPPKRKVEGAIAAGRTASQGRSRRRSPIGLKFERFWISNGIIPTSGIVNQQIEMPLRLRPRVATGSGGDRQEKFEELSDQFEHSGDPIRPTMARVMISFLAGLFAG
jgi:hypothetical protein